MDSAGRAAGRVLRDMNPNYLTEMGKKNEFRLSPEQVVQSDETVDKICICSISSEEDTWTIVI